MPLFVFSFIILISSFAFPEITITGVNGASYYENEIQSTPAIWGGIAGPSCTSNNDGVCNNCNGQQLPCNERRISLQTQLTISFQSSRVAGVPTLTTPDKQTRINNDILTPVNVNTNTSVTVRWGDICSRGSVDNRGCQASGQFNLHLGIDATTTGERSNGTLADTEDDSININIHIRNMGPPESYNPPQTGLVDFKMWPGDEKVWLLIFDQEEDEVDEQDNDDEHPLRFPEGFPNFDGDQFREIRFYYVEGDCNNARSINNNSDYVSTTIRNFQGASGVTLSKESFTQSDKPDSNSVFVNNTSYVFMSALTDRAGNVGFFTFGETGQCDPRKHVITPSHVIGLLSEVSSSRELNCPLSSAYANSHHSNQHLSFKILQTFYRFRDEKLLPYNIGRFVHDMYYAYTPVLANLIEDYTFLKPLARIAFLPLFIYASLALKIGHILTLLLFISFIGYACYLMKYLMKKKFYQLQRYYK